MYFNHRILQEAEKEYVPLLERLSFLGIYSNNLDEFFRVRVASLNRMLNQKLDKDTEQQIKKSLKTINKLNESYSKEYTEAVDTVFRELEVHKVRLLNEDQLNDEQKEFLTQFFYDKLNGSINPIWLNEIDDLSTLEDNRIYLAVEKAEDDKKKKKYAVVKVPDRVYGRWVKVPANEGLTTSCIWTMSSDTVYLWYSSVSRRAPTVLSVSSLPRMPKWRWTMMPTSEPWRRLHWV